LKQGNQDVAEEETMEEGLGMEVLQQAYELAQSMGLDLNASQIQDFLQGLTGLGVVAGIGVGAAKAAKADKADAMKEEASEELEEAITTIETLQEELNEVNLLNAKLLYLNKIFKSNNLTEAQKANTIASFDKAETVKEVKLVFETVNENLTVPATSKKSMNEVKGMASKAAGNAPKKAEIITEGNDVVARLQFLAGITKK